MSKLGLTRGYVGCDYLHSASPVALLNWCCPAVKLVDWRTKVGCALRDGGPDESLLTV